MNRWLLVRNAWSLLGTLACAAVLWAALIAVSGCRSPVAAVLSGSMEPDIARGDILFLWHDRRVSYAVGDIVVYRLPHRAVPIVHRVVELCVLPGGGVGLLTKGDANAADDRKLYAPGQQWLTEDAIVGRATSFVVPYMGLVSIVLADYWALKYVAIALVVLSMLLESDPGEEAEDDYACPRTHRVLVLQPRRWNKPRRVAPLQRAK